MTDCEICECSEMKHNCIISEGIVTHTECSCGNCKKFEPKPEKT